MKSLNRICGGLWISAALAAFQVQADAPSGYYSTCEGKSGRTLLTALSAKIGSHTPVSYNGLWNAFKKTDIDANGKIWDMYSTKRWTPDQNKCGNYSAVGDCYNREHSFPKSWFDDATPMYSDLYHLYPTDGKVNGMRSNLPFGECAGGTTVASSGSVKALGKIGASTFPGYSGKVFEPDDQYKGDFARSYFYMATRYSSLISSWNSPMLNGTSFPAFSTWALNMLLKWHREDPVSDKERKRNDAVYGYQHNRNPFIDYPELAEHIWGDKANVAWSENGAAEPAIVLPVNGSTISLGSAQLSEARTFSVNVKGTNLGEAVRASVNGAGFSVSPSSISASDAMQGVTLHVTVNSTTPGTNTATLTLVSGTAISTATLTVNVSSGVEALAATHVTSESFEARWVYGYNDNLPVTLTVKRGGETLPGYPVSITGSTEAYEVTDLDSETAYTYSVSSDSHPSTGNEISVTTGMPMPMITVMYDGDPTLESAPGEASLPLELLLDIQDIDDAVKATLTDRRFELSVDKTIWSGNLTLAPGEDRLYLRLNTSEEGTFTTTLRLEAGSYINDDTEFTGVVSSADYLNEDFESEEKGGYGAGEYHGTAGLWKLSDAGVWAGDPRHSGSLAARCGKSGKGEIELLDDRDRGLGIISFYGCTWNNDGEATVALEVSTDGGITWNAVKDFTLNTSSTWLRCEAAANVSGKARLRIRQKSGKRFLIDDIHATSYTSAMSVAGMDYHQWDAYSATGGVAIENLTGDAMTIRIYDMSGKCLHDGAAVPGRSTVSLPEGLYIVVSGSWSRRVFAR